MCATASDARTAKVSIFINVSSLDGLNQPTDDIRKGGLGLTSLVFVRFHPLSIREYHHLQVRDLLEARLYPRSLLEVVPDQGDGVNPQLLQGRRVEHTARRARSSEGYADDGNLVARDLV